MKKYAQLSSPAQRLFQDISRNEAHFISLVSVREKSALLGELQENGYIGNHSLHGSSGYRLTDVARREMGLIRTLATSFKGVAATIADDTDEE